MVKSILKSIYHSLKFMKECDDWRKENKHNLTVKGNSFDSSIIEIGKATYGTINVINSNTTSRISIGNYCSIAQHVTFIINSEHPTEYISTYPFKVLTLHTQQYEATSKGDIIVEDDVWIGHGAIINAGVTIGQGAVIASGAIVTKDIPPYAIAGGVPARVIKYRFNKDIIAQLETIDFSKIDNDVVRDNVNNIYRPIECEEDLLWTQKFIKNKA